MTEKSASQGKETIVDNFSFTGSMLAQAEYTNHRLLYLTPVLTEPATHLRGGYGEGEGCREQTCSEPLGMAGGAALEHHA
ncbi:MAG: hypothetical protein MZV63_49070 [Marinilabiliales bacterium]|nr:hypothetical protein [Marinilabiliales bacterium]